MLLSVLDQLISGHSLINPILTSLFGPRGLILFSMYDWVSTLTDTWMLGGGIEVAALHYSLSWIMWVSWTFLIGFRTFGTLFIGEKLLLILLEKRFLNFFLLETCDFHKHCIATVSTQYCHNFNKMYEWMKWGFVGVDQVLWKYWTQC